MKKGDITIKILEILQGVSEVGINVIGVACSASKGSMYRKAYGMTSTQRENYFGDWADNYRQRQKMSNLLCYLCREGLVQKRGRGKISFWKSTKAGRAKLLFLRQNRNSDIYRPLPKDGKTRLVIFDIFEQEKKKRNWMRKCLVNLGYKLLQKSVWQGYRPLPEEFIRSIYENGLSKHVHIFEVNKLGTLGIKE